MTHDSQPSEAERIDLPGGWYFAPRAGKDKRRRFWRLTRPDGRDFYGELSTPDARAFAAALTARPAAETEAERQRRIDLIVKTMVGAASHSSNIDPHGRGFDAIPWKRRHEVAAWIADALPAPSAPAPAAPTELDAAKADAKDGWSRAAYWQKRWQEDIADPALDALVPRKVSSSQTLDLINALIRFQDAAVPAILLLVHMGEEQMRAAQGLNEADSEARAAIANHSMPVAAPAPAATGGVGPDGWKLVPVKPTTAMKAAGAAVVGGFDFSHECWAQMLAATPVPPAATQGGEITDQLRAAVEPFRKALDRLQRFGGQPGASAALFASLHLGALYELRDGDDGKPLTLAHIERLVAATAPTPGSQGEAAR